MDIFVSMFEAFDSIQSSLFAFVFIRSFWNLTDRLVPLYNQNALQYSSLHIPSQACTYGASNKVTDTDISAVRCLRVLHFKLICFFFRFTLCLLFCLFYFSRTYFLTDVFICIFLFAYELVSAWKLKSIRARTRFKRNWFIIYTIEANSIAIHCIYRYTDSIHRVLLLKSFSIEHWISVNEILHLCGA